ncbi:MAG TPA: flagellar basal body L-ring protein FlgH [Stellaceae bacterium]|nr:flagellar basal body L-ring protein FlgH [Stellaceae bacterium]
MRSLLIKLVPLAPLLALTLSACGTATKLSQIGETPPMSTIQDPQQQPGYRPVSLPMPAPGVNERRPNSLWQAGSRAFFKDQRAANVGDILTVIVNFDEKGKFDDNTTLQRNSSMTSAIPELMGFQSQIQKILPHSADVTNLVNGSGTSNNVTTTEANREEQVNLRVAAEVTQVLPNGNLVVQGRQEIRVNYEVRELQIAGVLRPADITSVNTVTYDQLAEARISYGGRGQQMDAQQPRYGQQFFDIINPF